MEQVAAEGLPFLHSVAEDCPGVELLVASREAPPPAMGRVVPVNGLAYPPGDDTPGYWEAVELLAARRVQHSWTPLTRADRRAMGRIFSPELKALPDGAVATLSLAVTGAGGDSPALLFSSSLPASAGGVDGATVPIQIDNDAVEGVDQPAQQRKLFLPAIGR